jgi:hypothetical protein
MTPADASPELSTSMIRMNGSKLAPLLPIATAIAYPWGLTAFHSTILSGNRIGAAIWLIVAFGLPLSCLALAASGGSWLTPSARRLAYAGVTTPPLFVLVGVASGLFKSPVPERVTWVTGWIAAGVLASFIKSKVTTVATPSASRLQIAHGISAAIILLFLTFHLFNHLAGLIGPDTHARIMALGRRVYRSSLVEPVLVSLLLFQVISGVRLAWRWSHRAMDLPRAIQVGSGAYLAAFVLTHLNSALISARMVHHIDTGWGWASGGRAGLILDAWNIRLVPHYALGVFFVLTHIACGLRSVLLAHGTRKPVANRILWACMSFAAVLSVAILAGLCGARV